MQNRYYVPQSICMSVRKPAICQFGRESYNTLIYILHKIEEKINLYQQISLSFFRNYALNLCRYAKAVSNLLLF